MANLLEGPRFNNYRLGPGMYLQSQHSNSQRQEDLCVFKTSLVFITIPGQPKLHREFLVFQNKKPKTRKTRPETVFYFVFMIFLMVPYPLPPSPLARRYRKADCTIARQQSALKFTDHRTKELEP